MKSDAEIDSMRPAGHFAWELLGEVEKIICPGISTQDIDDLVVELTSRRGARSAPFNYRGFPKSVCTSVNEVVCHGIPSSKKKLVAGDIINVDVTPIVGGFHGDSSRTFFVGPVSEKARRLVECSRECLRRGLGAVGKGARIGDIGSVIMSHAQAEGFSVVREFVGHGIGRGFHEDPQIPHVGKAGRGDRLTPGMVFTIEPMINEKGWKCRILADDWTAVTVDGGLSAQFEHTIAIRSDWTVEVLTDPSGTMQ